MRVKTSTLIDVPLEYAVAIASGYRDANNPEEHTEQEEALCALNWTFTRGADEPLVWLANLCASTDWASGGPVVERERIEIRFEAACPKYSIPAQDMWVAVKPFSNNQGGPTPLIAAMRCYVASKLGDEVEIPDELTKG